MADADEHQYGECPEAEPPLLPLAENSQVVAATKGGLAGQAAEMGVTPAVAAASRWT